MPLPLVCVTINGHSLADMVAQAEKATGEGADIIEVRFDELYVERVEVKAENTEGEVEISHELVPRGIDVIDVPEAIERLKAGIEKPVLFTCRPRRQGGNFPGTEEERIEVIRQAVASGVSWVDLELDIEEQERTALFEQAAEAGTKVVASHHDMESTPKSADIQSFVAESRQYGDTVKLCYRSNGHGDGLSLCEAAWELRDDADLSLALMGQGVGGDMPRIHAPMFSQSLVYATLETDFNLPDRGMINVRDLRIAWEMLGYSEDSEE